MTKALVLAVVIGGEEAVVEDIVRPAMRRGDDFCDHVLTPTRHSRHSSLAHYRIGFGALLVVFVAVGLYAVNGIEATRRSLKETEETEQAAACQSRLVLAPA